MEKTENKNLSKVSRLLSKWLRHKIYINSKHKTPDSLFKANSKGQVLIKDILKHLHQMKIKVTEADLDLIIEGFANDKKRFAKSGNGNDAIIWAVQGHSSGIIGFMF